MPLVRCHFAVSSVKNKNRRVFSPVPIAALLAPLQGCSGVIERLEPQPGVAGQASEPELITWDPQPFFEAEVHGVFADGLVCGVPEWLPSGGFRLEVGCLQLSRFQQLSIVFDDQRRLQFWERRAFSIA